MGSAMKLLFPAGEHEPIELKDGETLVGSAPDCQIMLAAPGIAARHCALLVRGEQAQVRALEAAALVVPDAVMVEDLGSANGAFINNQRVHSGSLMKPGDELRLDTVRFMLVSIEQMQAGALPSRSEAPTIVVPQPKIGGGNNLWLVAGIVVVAVIVLGILKALGKI